nr:PREDICTED: mitogen-activated protein kinase kinase kinase YODA-like [Daucus carota subsp. sativus]
MPSWWPKSSSKDGNKKSNIGSLINTIHKKFRIVSEGKNNSGSGDSAGKQHCDSKHASRSPISPSSQVSRRESFGERPQALPLPLPGLQHNRKHRDVSSNIEATEAEGSNGSKSFMFCPLPKPPYGPDPEDAEADIGTASVSSDKSSDSDNTSDSCFPSPQAFGHKSGKAARNSPSRCFYAYIITLLILLHSVIKKNQSPKSVKNLNDPVPASLKPSGKNSHLPNLQIPRHDAYFRDPDSKMSSPSPSQVRLCGPELVMNSGACAENPCADLPMLGTGHCSNPGSGHNSVGKNLADQFMIWRHSRGSPECSPIPSPRMITSPGPSPKIQSGAVTPLRPRAGKAIELPAHWPDGKHEGHRLPLPPINYTSYSTETTPVPRSPSRASHGPRWKKGQLLGRGTFGHVYVGFDSENGEMCAMKEVTLFSDDPKSKESAQQLRQEVALLSRLRHPNIVQYLGSEVVDDKLYIYLEYVSGGSIYKLLRDYGQLGEAAIRSYTQQILSGLAYLHARHTIHRDIKGANLLVDPNGRVKLADFGMAKHISGQPCHLSFKGSPYWMAPEIIKNSSSCNVAVDIWSLGCTILEMATTKPPWSQFEGVAAIFKIGHSKELPDMPQNLSDDGKDFIRRCLQRNPLDRPSAAQLLEHPFVKNAAPPPMLVPCLQPLQTMPSVQGYGHAQNPPHLDRKGAARKHSRGPNIFSGSSNNAYVPRNIPLPSAVPQPTSSLLHPSSPWHPTPMLCASPGVSRVLTSGRLHEGMAMNSRSQESLNSNDRMSYKELQPELF